METRTDDVDVNKSFSDEEIDFRFHHFNDADGYNYEYVVKIVGELHFYYKCSNWGENDFSELKIIGEGVYFKHPGMEGFKEERLKSTPQLYDNLVLNYNLIKMLKNEKE